MLNQGKTYFRNLKFHISSQSKISFSDRVRRGGRNEYFYVPSPFQKRKQKTQKETANNIYRDVEAQI